VHSLNAQSEHRAVEVPRLACRFRQASKAISAIVASLGLVVLGGWAFNVPILTYIRPSFQSTKVNTALSFLCLGTALWLAQNDKWQRSRRILGLLVVIIGGLTLAEYAFHVSLGIDQLLFRDTRSPSLSAYPGRMAIATAICFVFLGLVVAFLGLKKALVLQRSLVAICFALSVVALCGYLYGVKSLYSITPFSTMGLQSAAGVFAACLACFLARPDEGIVSIAASDTNSGLLLRTVIPAIVVVPIVIGWLRLAGQRANLYEMPFGVTLQVLGSIGCLTVLTLVIARSMHRLELERSYDQKTIRESEQRLRLATQAGKMYAYDWDITADVVVRSSEHIKILGLTEPLHFPHQEFVDKIHPDDRSKFLAAIAGLTPENPTGEVTYRALATDGASVWLKSNGRGFFDAEGRLLRVIGMVGDVTDQKLAEEALRTSEELLKTFVKNVPAAVAMLDRDMRYLQVSDRWCTDYLSGKTQILGCSHYEIFPDMPERWKEVHRRALQGETLRAEEDRWDGQNGTHWARWEVRPWKTAEGSVGGILIFAEDITGRKQMEEALSEMSRKLIESQEQERARIGRELHDDINQRLAMLSLELEQLQENPSEVQTRVQELRKQTTELSNDVQALSHDLHSSKLEYLGVVAGMKSWCKEFAERQRIEFDCTTAVSSPLPPEIGLSLFRVLQEALNNVIKHSGVKRVEVQLREDSGEIHLVISDLGRGFDVEAASQGKGLGLMSMRERVRLVNGTISIESKPMGGTTIHVRMPLGSKARTSAGGCVGVIAGC
jgi:PAS domain S-box-containing protein